MEVALEKKVTGLERFNTRLVEYEDYIQIGELDLITIIDTVEYLGESKGEAIEEMRLTFEGKYGDFLPDASYVIIHDDKIVAAIILVLSKQEKIPLVAFAMTHPYFRKKGMCRLLLSKSINSLIDLG